MDKNSFPSSNAPVVTGISPKEGPPGTRVTIRGENFGQKSSDLLSVTICGCDCTLSAEWKSPNKIIARSGPEKGKGDILVTTKQGGVGTCTVQFRAYHETIGPTKESAVWVEEAPIHTLSWCRRSLSPTSYQQEDPLGLSVEGNEKKMPEDDLNELFPNGSGDLAAKNFSAGWFLLEHHHMTNFDDLKAGLSYLRRKVDGQKEGQLSFLKSNVGSVVDQLDMLAKLKEKLEQDLKGGVELTEKVESKIQISKEEAHKLFQEVLTRRERADATRNALTVLTRFKFLFCLPSTIDKNIQRGDFDLVINDYARVKNLFGDKDIHIFKKVMAEIENRISQAREVLTKKLKDVPPTFEEHVKLIRSLIHLETPGDPAWMGIECYANYLMSSMNDFKDKYIVIDSSESAKKNKLPSKTYLDTQGIKPHRILYIEDLVDFMEIKFPDLWKFGQMYFGGELYCSPNTEKHKPYKSTVLNVIEHFCHLIRAAILPHTLNRSSHHRHVYGIWSNSGLEMVILWLPHCLRYVRACYSSFTRIDLPSDVLDIFSTLLFDLRFHCVSTIFKQAAENIGSLYKLENWSIDINESYGGITDLPHQCDAKFREVMQMIHDSVQYGEVREVLLTENPTTKKEMCSLIQQLFSNFIQVMEKLVFENSDELCDRPTVISQLIYTSDVNKSASFGTITWEQRLLAVMCNCQYTADVILPGLFELMRTQGYQITDEFISTCQDSFTALSHKILDQYNEQKCDPLVGTIEPSMYVAKFDWDTSFEPVDIRPYAKEIIMNLIGVRSELYRVPIKLVHKIMLKIVDTVAEELARLMSCVKGFSLAGSIQARADVLAVKEATKSYVTKKGLKFYEEALNAIPLVNEEGENFVSQILENFRNNMSLQLSGLTETEKTGH